MSEETPDILPEVPETPDTEKGGVENPDNPETEMPETPDTPDVPGESDNTEETEDAYTVADYLQGISPLLTAEALRVVLAKRKLKGDTPIEELDERDLDLAEAEVYYQLCNLPVGGSTTKDVDGSWSHTEGGWTVSGANLAEWWKKYVSLRQKWGESVLNKSTIRVHARGMRIWRRR